ncbi:unnamed protein product [Mesocestoides corti]|uniref:Uncharacterized protein n=1 Tax=Mesocestoides corti TaxID=53468 RepID=A0A158QVN7_MESCO|nr:unnamed protein product [Mesocestoides corti]
MYQKGLRLLVECRNPSLGDPALIATAAESGHVKAREVIVTASALAWGGLPLSVEKAVEGFRHLAEEGNPRGQLGLGIMYAAGVGVNASIPRALVYQTFAALGGDELAEMAMGYRYLVGAGVEPNCETALAYYRRVAATVAEQVENRIKEGAGPTLTGPTVVRINLLEEREQALGGGGGAALSNYFISDDILSYYKFVADSNNVSAQVTLGQLYYNGQHGIDLDHKLALHYFKRAADSGSHLAMAYLGEMYLVGSPDVPKDESLALNYLQRAVIAGNPLALTSLGLAYLHGRAGLTPDPVKAMDLFVKAADQGWAEAQLQLGLLFMGTVGRTSDYKMALKYFTLASQQGNTLAFYNLGQMHATGMGVFRSCSTATEDVLLTYYELFDARFYTQLFKNVAERGRWSQLLTSAYLEYWSGNRGAAFLQYLALAELGYEVAQSNVALMLEDVVTRSIRDLQIFVICCHCAVFHSPPQICFYATLDCFLVGDVDFIPKTERYERALVYWKRSAGQGSSSSRVKLGDYYFYGLGTEVNYEQAIQEYRIATDVLRNAQAMFNLGYMHEQGLGFKRDLYLAKRFYDMAAETSSDAQIPAALALVKLSFHFALDFLRKAPIIRWIADLFSSSSDGATARNSEVTMQMDWDFYIIPLLAGLLAILIVYIRLQR